MCDLAVVLYVPENEFPLPTARGEEMPVGREAKGTQLGPVAIEDSHQGVLMMHVPQMNRVVAVRRGEIVRVRMKFHQMNRTCVTMLGIDPARVDFVHSPQA